VPITSFLNGVRFDRETTRVMGVAFELTRLALGIAERRDEVNEVVAKTISCGCRSVQSTQDIRNLYFKPTVGKTSLAVDVRVGSMSTHYPTATSAAGSPQ
jgi:hypothetical protein